ncbi:MAG TPA: pyridoxamine 5'-phosphate oxidase family protein [Mycobacterium sp.]|nr:pyridoxamine 5'-phosphate oxidase family protein [Mycobacterium sp.]
MSIKVDLDRLSDALSDFGLGYLITVGDDFRAHTVSIDTVISDGVFNIDHIGNTTRRNVIEHADVTLLWPPREQGGYSLIVDGRGEVHGDGLCATPTRAVLHRSATPRAPSASGCAEDCMPLAEG